jgi:hypothetical protein
MPRSCTVCTHPDRAEIDERLVSGVSSAEIAGRYRTLGERAIRRHRTNHVPETLAKAHEAEEVAQADSLLEQVRDLQERALDILDKAEEAGELRTALSAIREARGNLELLAKLLGELDERPQVNVLLSPEWLQIRTSIVAALEPHPDTLSDVLSALEDGGNGRA